MLHTVFLLDARLYSLNMHHSRIMNSHGKFKTSPRINPALHPAPAALPALTVHAGGHK